MELMKDIKKICSNCMKEDTFADIATGSGCRENPVPDDDENGDCLGFEPCKSQLQYSETGSYRIN